MTSTSTLYLAVPVGDGPGCLNLFPNLLFLPQTNDDALTCTLYMYM